MGIRLNNLQEGCCDKYPSHLSYFYGDSFDANRPTCDRIIDCQDKYILVEEKSFLLGFLNDACKEAGTHLGAFIDDFIIKDDIIDFIDESFTLDAKKRIFAESVTTLFMSSLEKVSNTTHILATKYDADKSSNMPIIYLYCNSGKSKIDKLASLSLAKYKNEKKQVMVECDKLEKFLQQKGCA